MSLVKVTNLKFNYGDKELYNSVSFQINAGEHAVLLGRNGAGKTTLFDLLVKKIIPDGGEIEWTPKVTYSYLDQHYKINDDFTVKEYLENIYKELFKKEEIMNSYYELGSDISNPKYDKYLEMASQLNDELIINNFYSIKEEISKVLVGLGINKEKFDTKLTSLSSGQREKVYLAKMLLEKSDLLLLDEPTNYLDAIHVNWLISYLNSYEKSYLIISHDEYFLSQIANVVFALENKTITRYKGSYDYYLEQSKIRKEQYEKDFMAQQRYIKKEEEFIAAHIVRATSSRAAKSRRTRLSHLEKLEAPVDDKIKVHFSFPYSSYPGKKVLQTSNLIIGYSKQLLSPINLSIEHGNKIVIVGKNGVGKSTFIKTILGMIPSLGGTYTINEKVNISYFSQTEMDDLSITPFEYVQNYTNHLTNNQIRGLLARSGIKAELVNRKLKDLSGGEEAKTRLSILTQKKCNLLILDEPTNHLDVIAKESLKKALEEYEGTLILVTHEKDFYSSIADTIIAFE